ncbi:unnamed protein product [Cylindrotheca closterium]|uniref:Uncharacterized protein n=1 Tax=Cylindrotheca closterium TaxID=2856 RepID=A0AAD2CJG5_9STRA|nr:unnamed protein product [Cylindrotheca closterium]
MLERHVKVKEGITLSDDEISHNRDSSSNISAQTSSSKENLKRTINDDQMFQESDEDDVSDHSDDSGTDKSKRKSVLEMANAIESSISLSSPVAVRKPAVTLGDDAGNVGKPSNQQPQSQFWSLQDSRRSSVTSTLSKIKRPPQPSPSIHKSPVQVPKETVDAASLDLDISFQVSPVTSPAAICTMPATRPPSPKFNKSSNRTVTTRETMEGPGPKVRMTRSTLLRLKGKEKQRQQKQKQKHDETALKPRTNGFVNSKLQTRSRIPRQKDYPKPWLVSDAKKATSRTRTGHATTQQGPDPSTTGKEPQISQLPGRRSRSKPAAKTTQAPGKVRLTRSAILKLRQSQEKAANQVTQQDLDNQRLGIPPVKFLQIPNSPTKIDFEDDEMEHPNDIARRKLRELFDGNSKPKAR